MVSPNPNQEQPTFEDLEILAEVSQLLTVVDLDGVMQKVIELAKRAVGAKNISLFLQEGDQVDWDHLITMRNLTPDKSFQVVTTVLNKGFAGWVSRQKEGAIIHDTFTDDRWHIFPDDPSTTRSALCVPFIHNDQVRAVMTLVHDEPSHFKPYHLRLMTIIANQATIALRNAQLFNTVNSQRRQLNAVLQSITDALLVLDQSGQILMLNEAALPLMEIEQQEQAIKQHIAEFVWVDSIFMPIVEAIKKQQIPDKPFKIRSDRRQIDFQMTMTNWEDPLRHTAGYVLIMHDISEFEDLSRFKDEMLRLAGHDLRSPLALIAGYADMIALDTPEQESPVHGYVEVIKDSIDKMGSLIDDLLRVERVRNSPLELHEKTDPLALVKVVIVNSRIFAEAKELDLRTDLHLDNAPHIVVDRVLLRQAMTNLIHNAIKYTPKGGSVQVQAYIENEKFHFLVQDTGIGIAEEHLSHIFESFYRVDDSKDYQKGSGLGLSLVKNVIARHHGEIWVKSRPNQGSRFGFWLPIKKEKSLERE